jgi:ABC-type multidrug transport system ATPase subunit/CRP-like cAMP-binding protein
VSVPAAAAPDILYALRRVPLFQSLDDATLRSFAASLDIREASRNDVIVRAGEAGEAMFVILAGHVRVVADVDDERALLARLGPGEFFGEMALLTGEPRTASVVADSPARLARIARDRFEGLAAGLPAVREEAERVMARRRDGASRRFETEARTLGALSLAAGRLTIGSAADCDFVTTSPGVGASHAALEAREGAWWLVDLGTPAGTLLNRAPVDEAPMAEGDVITLGTARLFLSDGVLKVYEQSRGVRVDVRGLSVRRGNRDVLHDINVTILPGEFVAIVGPSGAGKTTLMDTLVSLRRPTAGSATFDGSDDAEAMRRSMGYVPQYDTVHGELTVRQSLRYAARLRLPALVSQADLDARIDAVLQDLSLSGQQDQLVRSLSGGQRKRVCIAAELLTDPGILFLDEPTSGLDPGLDEALMLQLRELADEGRTVVITTHATRNIRVCDRVLVLNGGRLVFDGTPAEALPLFAVDDFAETYRALGTEAPDAQAARYAASAPAARQAAIREALRAAPAVPAGLPPAGAGVVRQWATVAARSFRVLLRDRFTMGLRVLGAPVLAAIVLGSFSGDVFKLTFAEGGNADQAVILLYLSSTITLFLGAFTAANAIVGEDGIFRRESLVNLSPLAYVLAKIAVLGAFSLVGGVLFAAVIAAKVEFPSGGAWAQYAAILALVSLAGTAMGMFISSLSPNPDRAVLLVVLALVPQLIFAGATIPKTQMSTASDVVSHLTVTRWSLEVSGAVTGLEERFATQARITDPVTGREVLKEYRPFEGAFAIAETPRWIVLAGFTVVFTAGTYLAQRRKAG